jgi:hypothetical protein
MPFVLFFFLLSPFTYTWDPHVSYLQPPASLNYARPSLILCRRRRDPKAKVVAGQLASDERRPGRRAAAADV